MSDTAGYILYIPDIALEKIFSFLTYDEIAKNREACMSVNNAQKVMIIGQSKDLGFCRSIKNNGEKCTSFVNLNNCEFCIYHIKKEYQKCSSTRSELQANFVGKGLTGLRNKVLGKNEVFYAGKSYMAIPASKSKKLTQKDNARLKSLSENKPSSSSTMQLKNTNKKKKSASNLELSYKQRSKDLERLRKLGCKTICEGNFDLKSNFSGVHSNNVSLETSKDLALSTIAKLKANKNNNASNINVTQKETNEVCKIDKMDPVDSTTTLQFNFPKLSHNNSKNIDLSVPISKKKMNEAKLKALEYIEKHGRLKKMDSNNVHGCNKKRVIENLDNTESCAKKTKLDTSNIEQNPFQSERFKKLMAATSKHTELLDEKDDEEKEKYFKKLEIKERMEEKMLTTYKIACKAVRCLKCKYTNFSASELCKKEKHPLKVFDSMKRFFKCGDCGNRTVCLEIIPLLPCKNCGSGKWEKTSMMKERKVDVTPLSIRGHEQTFVNSVLTDANINLLVPDND